MPPAASRPLLCPGTRVTPCLRHPRPERGQRRGWAGALCAARIPTLHPTPPSGSHTRALAGLSRGGGSLVPGVLPGASPTGHLPRTIPRGVLGAQPLSSPQLGPRSSAVFTPGPAATPSNPRTTSTVFPSPPGATQTGKGSRHRRKRKRLRQARPRRKREAGPRRSCPSTGLDKSSLIHAVEEARVPRGSLRRHTSVGDTATLGKGLAPPPTGPGRWTDLRRVQ